MTDLISSKVVTARKSHHCANCNTIAIQRGEKYVRDVYVYDGRVYTWISCHDCNEIAGKVYDWCYSPDEGVGADEFQEWAEEHENHPELGEKARAYLSRRMSMQS